MRRVIVAAGVIPTAVNTDPFDGSKSIQSNGSVLTAVGIILGMGAFITSAFAACLPVNPITKQACITYQGYSAGKSYQGNRHKYYFTNTCRQRLQITYEWVNATPRKWSHKQLGRGRQNISCLQGVCPGPVVWAPVCRDGSLGASRLIRPNPEVASYPAVKRRQLPAFARSRQDRQIIGTWDFKNIHDCPRIKMRCNGRYDFVSKKGGNKYLFRGVISCRRAVKRGVQAKLKSAKTFTSYFNEIWTLKNGRITATSQTKSTDKNVSALTLVSTLRGDTFTGTGPTCKGAGRQSWSARKRVP